MSDVDFLKLELKIVGYENVSLIKLNGLESSTSVKVLTFPFFGLQVQVDMFVYIRLTEFFSRCLVLLKFANKTFFTRFNDGLFSPPICMQNK